MNVDRLRWINSRHVRALFAEDIATDEHRVAVANEVLPTISSALKEAGLPSSATDIVDKFGYDYIWRAMDLMKVGHSTLLVVVRVQLPH